MWRYAAQWAGSVGCSPRQWRSAWCRASAGVGVQGELGVEVPGDADGDVVVDWPEGADDVAVASEQERCGEMGCFVGLAGTGVCASPRIVET